MEEYEGRIPHTLKLFLDYTGLTELEFMEVVERHKLLEVTETPLLQIGKKPDDFEKLVRHPSMDLVDSQEMLRQWREENS